MTQGIDVSQVEFETQDETTPWSRGITVKGRKFLIVEADGLAAEQYKSAQIAGSVFNQGTKDIQIGEIGKVENVLVGNCAWTIDEATNQTQYRAGYAIVQKWPGKLVSELFDQIKEESGLNEPDDEKSVEDLLKDREEIDKRLKEFNQDKLGNSQAGTMFGS